MIIHVQLPAMFTTLRQQEMHRFVYLMNIANFCLTAHFFLATPLIATKFSKQTWAHRPIVTLSWPSAMTFPWECASGLTVLTSLRSALDLLTRLWMYCWPLSLLRSPLLLAMTGLGMPQHVHVIMLTAVECAWNGCERPTRSTRWESII